MPAEAVHPQVVQAELDDALLRRPADDRGAERQLEQLRKDRDDVDAHGSAHLLGVVGGDDHEAGPKVDASDGRAQGRDEALATGTDDAVHLVAAGAEDLDELADQRAVGRLDPEADEVLPEVGALLEGALRRLEVAADEGLGRFARVDPLEMEDMRPPAGLRADDAKRAIGTVRPDLGARL